MDAASVVAVRVFDRDGSTVVAEVDGDDDTGGRKREHRQLRVAQRGEGVVRALLRALVGGAIGCELNDEGGKVCAEQRAPAFDELRKQARIIARLPRWRLHKVALDIGLALVCAQHSGGGPE